jgi:hypothetical protein
MVVDFTVVFFLRSGGYKGVSTTDVGRRGTSGGPLDNWFERNY